MFQIADLLAIVAGAIAGAVAFLPFVFTLKPVLDDKQNADMLKGMVSLAVSAIALLVFTLVVFALFGEAFRMFLLGRGDRLRGLYGRLHGSCRQGAARSS